MTMKRQSWLGALALLIMLALVLAQGQAEPSDNGVSAGAARFDITPDLRLSNWVTHKPYGEMLEPVYVRALVLAQNTNKIACVSWELLYPLQGAVAQVRKMIARETGIAEPNLLVTATHNHSAPWSPAFDTPLTKPERKVLELFMTDPLYPAWTAKLLDLSIKAVKQADASRKRATLAIGRAYAGDLIFNRRSRNLGTDECEQLLVDAAVRLLKQQREY